MFLNGNITQRPRQHGHITIHKRYEMSDYRQLKGILSMSRKTIQIKKHIYD